MRLPTCIIASAVLLAATGCTCSNGRSGHHHDRSARVDSCHTHHQARRPTDHRPACRAPVGFGVAMASILIQASLPH